MTSISNALFWISNGLLVPVVVLLLFFFLRAVLMIGGFFGEFWQKAKLQQQMNDILEKLTPENTEEFYKQLPADKNIPILHCLHKLYDHRENDAYCERLLANYEVDAEKDLGRSRSFNRRHCLYGLQHASGFRHDCRRHGDSSNRGYHVASETTLVCPRHE